MRVEIHDAPAPFEAAARGFLECDQAHNTLLLSTLERSSGAPAAAWWSAIASRKGRSLACALRDRRAALLSSGAEDAARGFGRLLSAEDWLESIVGPEPMATACAAELGRPVRTHAVLPLMQLTRAAIPPAARPAGTMRIAGNSEFDLLLEWSEAFRTEARLIDTPESIHEALRSRIERQQVHLWVDESGAPVSFAGWRQIRPSAARVAPVYTPPSLRGRGYAHALVAGICGELQARGAQAIFLFTDATNPTSNALYARIGFATVGRHLHLIAERGAD
jgi:ribosomal protein S18 acetylase RimI-like enzyme